MKILTRLFLIILTASVFFPSEALACACCAERGEYSVSNTEMDEDLIRDLEKIDFGSAELYADAGYPETVIGIDPIGNAFTVLGGLQGKSWSFNLTDELSRKASLSLWRPSTAEHFMVDQNPLSESTMPILYKELRFNYRVHSADGYLKNGIDADTEYKLILQGKGNVCMNASDYSTYILQVKGNTASYSFHGKLIINEDRIMQSHIDSAGRRVSEF